MAREVAESPSFDSINRVTRRLAELRWPIVIIVVGAAALHQALLFALLRFFPNAPQEWIHLAIYSLTGLLVVWVGLRALLRTTQRQEQAEADLQAAYAELEQTHRQLQTIHEVGRRVANSSDVQELLEIAARIPVELLGAASASVITFDAEQERSSLEMTYGLDAGAVQALRRQAETAHSGQRCANCQPLTAHVNSECHLLASVQAAGGGSNLDRIVCMPLGRGEERSGVVSAYLLPGVQPSSEQIHLASILATEVTGALEAARLRARQMATLYAVDQATQERRSLDALLSRVLDTTIDGWGVQTGAILLLAGDSWDVHTHRGMGNDLAAPTFGQALRLADRARVAGQPIVIQEQVSGGAFPAAAVLLLQTEGKTLGALFLASQEPGAFKPAQVELMRAIASQIALAVRNAQLYSQLRQTAVLEERYRLSREMHDGLAQTLGYLGMQAERIEGMVERGEAERLPAELKELRQVIAEAYLDLRETIDGLRLTVDQPGGFYGALRAHVADFTRRSGLPVDCSRVDALADLPPDVALHLLRIAQEALANVRRHAHASRVAVSLARENGALELTVADDGQGFDASSPLERSHVGLASMRERVRSLDGQLTFATSPGQGTRITARVPLAPAAPPRGSAPTPHPLPPPPA
ncbi:MAG TPA: GAF domain-containing protein [Anaerolineae bacterium]|nr:GAF domain-containing protein [Anaerolineae bacterium]